MYMMSTSGFVLLVLDRDAERRSKFMNTVHVCACPTFKVAVYRFL